MSNKKKYNWNEPSLFPDDKLHPANMELREIRTGINKHGEVYRNAVITKTKEYFIEQARKIWGDRYDYTDSEYTHGKAPITIYCPRHDYHFRVAMAQNHIMKERPGFKPTGCPICAAEKLHGCEYGTDWRRYLKVCAKNNRVGRIYQHKTRPIKTPEQRAAEEAERQTKIEAKRREEQAYIEKWHAKNLKEARFMERLQEAYPGMYDTSLVDYIDKDHRVTLICKEHGEFRIAPRMLFTSERGREAHGCWRCAGLIPPDERTPTMTEDEFFHKMHHLYDATNLDFMTSEYHGLKKKVTAYCHKHGFITHYAEHWLEGKGCEYCNGKFYPPDFLRLAREKHGNKYQYRDIKNIKSTQNYIRIHCDNPDHHWHRQRVDLHLQGFGCVECSNYPNKKTPQQRCDEWIKKCIKKYGEGRYDYSRAHEDYVNNDSFVWIRCCIHDYWFQQTPDNNLRTVNGSCPICSIEFRESEGEAEIRRWLVNHGITNFKQDEVTLPVEDPRCKRQYLRPDFWLPDYNLFIEYNGEQHYEDIEHFHDGYWTLEDQQIRDEAMRKYCSDHGHNLLEIPYWDFDRIDEILTAQLLKIND